MTVLSLLDTTPLRDNPAFRRLWIGTSFQALAGQFSAFAVLFQIWNLTHSTLITGIVGLTLAVPMVVFGLWGGVLADTKDRRWLVLVSNLGAMVFALALVAQAVLQLDSSTLLLGLAAAQAGCIAIGQPARKALISDLLPRDQVSAGIALFQSSFQVAMLGGPVLAGVIVGLWGIAACYGAEVVAFAIAFWGLAGLRKAPPPQSDEDRFALLVAGFQTIWRRPVLRGALLTDLAAMMLAMPIALFPALNEARFGGGPETLGLFFLAIAIGGTGAILLSGSLTRQPRQGAIQLGAALAWGGALVGAGMVQTGWLTLGFLTVAGAADTIAVIARGSVVQLSCEPQMRGRVLAVEQVVGVAAPQIGNFRAGATAAILPPGAAIVCGGLLCILAVIGIGSSHKQLVRFRSATPLSSDGKP